MSFWEQFKPYLAKYASQLIMLGVIVVLCFFLIRSCEKNISNGKIYDNNIKALTEEVQIWKTKSGDLVAEKTALEGDYKLLELTNKDLYDQINKLKVKPTEVIYVNSEIIRDVHDTTYVIDSTYVKKSFDFSDEWRTLKGYIEYDQPNLDLAIDSDMVKVDYAIAIKDSKVYVTSNNPYVQYNDVQGIVLPKREPRWSIGVGPEIGVGYDFLHNSFAPYVGVGVSFNYNIYSFGTKK